MVKSQIFTLAFIGYPFAPSFFIFLSRAPRSFSRARYARELTNVFEKKEKKSKTTSVYRLEVTIPGKEKFSFCCLFLVRASLHLPRITKVSAGFCLTLIVRRFCRLAQVNRINFVEILVRYNDIGMTTNLTVELILHKVTSSSSPPYFFNSSKDRD